MHWKRNRFSCPLRQSLCQHGTFHGALCKANCCTNASISARQPFLRAINDCAFHSGFTALSFKSPAIDGPACCRHASRPTRRNALRSTARGNSFLGTANHKGRLAAPGSRAESCICCDEKCKRRLIPRAGGSTRATAGLTPTGSCGPWRDANGSRHGRRGSSCEPESRGCACAWSRRVGKYVSWSARRKKSLLLHRITPASVNCSAGFASAHLIQCKVRVRGLRGMYLPSLPAPGATVSTDFLSSAQNSRSLARLRCCTRRRGRSTAFQDLDQAVSVFGC